MQKKDFDLAIIGSGPGGYVAALRAAQLGFSVCLIEARELGGTCLNRGCIPSKALIASSDAVRDVRESNKHGITIGSLSFDYQKMVERKDKIVNGIVTNLEKLIASNKITVLRGYGKLISQNQIKIQGEDDSYVEAKQIILATGSEPRTLQHIPCDSIRIHDSTSLLALQKLPSSLTIVGGGVIGCEFASLYHSLGVQVTIVELLPSILATEGKQISEQMLTILKKQGIRILTNTEIQEMEHKADHLVVHLVNQEAFQTEQALICVGRRYNTDQIGLEKAGVITRGNGTIVTNEQMQTNVPHIYAIGDITGHSLLAHVASHQGLVAVDHLAGLPTQMEYRAIPSVIFTRPEVATVGLTVERAREKGYDAIASAFPFQALGKAQATGHTEGFAQVITSQSTGEILGAQVIGENSSILIAEITLAIQAELTSKTIYETIHAHPTSSEAWMEAFLLADQRPLHLFPKQKKSSYVS